jgi:hypothetical protein
MAVVPIHWETHDVGLVGDLELPWDRRVAELANIRANGKQVFITERDGSHGGTVTHPYLALRRRAGQERPTNASNMGVVSSDSGNQSTGVFYVICLVDRSFE